MALDTTKVKLPASVVTEISGKVKDTSTIAALSPARPKIFNDENYMVFNSTSEGEVVAEGAKKGSYENDIDIIVGKRFKVVTTTRVSNELQWADEDNQLEIINAIQEDQTAAIGRVLDYVVYHRFNPKPKQALSGFTGLVSDSSVNTVTATDDPSADIDNMVDALIDYGISGIALSRLFASALRKLRVPATGMRLYPEIPLNLNVGDLDGIPAATSNTVNGRLITPDTGVRAIMGDFNMIKWGMVRDMWSEVIEYGDPDGTGNDLKAYNQIAFRTEAVMSYAVLEPAAFAVLKEGE
ncbi:MAG TPA: phage major capsid protein [Eggerthellaceae bacterium]|nr:phage major capsid protein [Eggerthellaceae bacterium]